MGFSDILLSSPSTVLGAVLVLILVYLVLGLGSDQGPPGPRPVPVLGNLLQLDLKRPYNTLMELSKQYGSVFTVWLGPKKVVVLAGYETVKEALVDHADVFGERDTMPIALETMEKNFHGVIWGNDESWRDLRRFALTNLRDFGMGKRACEDKITEETQFLCDVLKNFKDDDVLLDSSNQDLQTALGQFAAECEAAGIKSSSSKSEAMDLGRKKAACPLWVGGVSIHEMEKFKYLGVFFTSEGHMEPRDRPRIAGERVWTGKSVRLSSDCCLCNPTPDKVEENGWMARKTQ